MANYIKAYTISLETGDGKQVTDRSGMPDSMNSDYVVVPLGKTGHMGIVMIHRKPKPIIAPQPKRLATLYVDTCASSKT